MLQNSNWTKAFPDLIQSVSVCFFYTWTASTFLQELYFSAILFLLRGFFFLKIRALKS